MLIIKAYNLISDNKRLAVVCGKLLIEGGYFSKRIKIHIKIPASVSNIGRLKLYEKKALIEINQLDKAGKIVNKGFEMADVNEGKLSISDLWFELHKRLIQREIKLSDEAATDFVKKLYSLSCELDFRMHV